MMDCGCSIGIVVLTVVYIGFVFAIGYSPLDVSECLHEPCNSEGVDNYILNWATDFFVALALLLFTLHLLLSKQRRVLKAAILTQLFMCGAYVQFGLAHMMYPNDATGDAKGLRFYWILSWIAYSFLTLSTMTLVAFVEKVSPRKSRKSWWGKAMLRFFLGMTMSFSVSFLVGCIWCGISPEIHVDEIIDEFNEIVPHPKCVKLIESSEIGWRVSYALLWIPASLLLRAAANKNPATLFSLPSPCAPLDLILIQSTIGFVFHVWIKWAAHALVYDETELFENVYGSIIIHYGMLLTFYMLYGLSMTLAKNAEKMKSKSKNKLEQMEEGEESGMKGANVDKTIHKRTQKHTGVKPKALENPKSKKDLSLTGASGLQVSEATRKQLRKQAIETENKQRCTVESEHEKPPLEVGSTKLEQQCKRSADMEADTESAKGIAEGLKSEMSNDVEESRQSVDRERPGPTHENWAPRQHHFTESICTDAAVASESDLFTEFVPDDTVDNSANFAVSLMLPGATMKAMNDFHQAASAAVRAAVQTVQNGIQLPATFNFVSDTDSPTSPSTDSDQQTVSTISSSDSEPPQPSDGIPYKDRPDAVSETRDAEIQGFSKRDAAMENNFATAKSTAPIVSIDKSGNKPNEGSEVEKDPVMEVRHENCLGEDQTTAGNDKPSPEHKIGYPRRMQDDRQAGRAQKDGVSKTRLNDHRIWQLQSRQLANGSGADALIPPSDATVRSKKRPRNEGEVASKDSSPSFYIL